MSLVAFNAIALAIKEGLALVRDLSNPENQRTLENVKRYRKLGKAANITEKIFIIVDKILTLKPDGKAWKKQKKKYLKLKRAFNKND